jgi:hypothetical protein
VGAGEDHKELMRLAAARHNLPLPVDEIGAGDVVANVTTALGFKPCESCEERRKRLNAMLSIGRRRE